MKSEGTGRGTFRGHTVFIRAEYDTYGSIIVFVVYFCSIIVQIQVSLSDVRSKYMHTIIRLKRKGQQIRWYWLPIQFHAVPDLLIPQTKLLFYFSNRFLKGNPQFPAS